MSEFTLAKETPFYASYVLFDGTRPAHLQVYNLIIVV